jgi:hypothetical protein
MSSRKYTEEQRLEILYKRACIKYLDARKNARTTERFKSLEDTQYLLRMNRLFSRVMIDIGRFYGYTVTKPIFIHADDMKFVNMVDYYREMCNNSEETFFHIGIDINEEALYLEETILSINTQMKLLRKTDTPHLKSD